MRHSRRTPSRRILRRQQAARPTVFTLLIHIVASAFTGGMFMILAFGGVLVTFFYYNNFSPDNLLALLFGTMTVMAFYRGCLAWQQDLNEYQSRMSDIRHTREFKNMDRN
jgi:4-hydroxybenzoate polyprenyltransferase